MNLIKMIYELGLANQREIAEVLGCWQTNVSNMITRPEVKLSSEQQKAIEKNYGSERSIKNRYKRLLNDPLTKKNM